MHYLPNTQLEFYVSPKRFVQFGGTEPDRGVVPDFVQEKDPVNFTHQLIEEGRAKIIGCR